MTTRTRTLGLAVTAAALTLPAPALAARFTPLHRATDARMHALDKKKKPKSKLPVVTSVSPKSLAVGGTLTVHGRNFLTGRGRNTVVFQRQGGRYIFVKSGLSTSRKMWVKIPSKMTTSLTKRGTGRAATRFRLRVLTKVFAKSFTPTRMSPVIFPPTAKPAPTKPGGSKSPTLTPAPKPVTTAPTCDATGKTLPAGGDADKDGLPNAREVAIHTNPCLADTDGDGLSDFWEYKSALDYNQDALPYPGKRPYPNALDPSDAGIDHDGDGMTAADEYAAWVRWGNKDLSKPLFMSDGTQSSMSVVHVTNDPLDMNGDGILTDDERDSDLGDPTGKAGDGLTNWDEAHGRMVPEWWTAIVTDEKPYGLSSYKQTDWLDPDTDGDGVPDGADDTDHDGYSNAFEVSRQTYWNQPFNPCLPNPIDAPIDTCSKHPPPPDESWPPFDYKKVPLTFDPPFGGRSTPFLMADLIQPTDTGSGDGGGTNP